MTLPLIPGQIIPASGEVEINAGPPATPVSITNTSSYPVHLTAHFHVFEANPRLQFDRRKTWGMRPDVPANGAVRFEPGSTVDVPLVPIGGRRVVHGFQGVVNGSLDERDMQAALDELIARGFLHVQSNG
jgi:urease beta subunit